MIIIGHRGASALAPENTLASFRKARELGLTAVELDVHLSAEGEVVVIHDPTVDRTTDGVGAVAELTVAELQALDAGSSLDTAFAGERIPTLAEVLDAFAEAIDFQIEVKPSDPAVLDRLCPKVAALADRYGMSAESQVISFHDAALAAMGRAAPQRRLGLLSGSADDDLFVRAQRLGCSLVCVQIDCVDADLVGEARERGLGLTAWTANTADQLRRAAACGVDGCATDHPDLALRVLEI